MEALLEDEYTRRHGDDEDAPASAHLVSFLHPDRSVLNISCSQCTVSPLHS